MVILNRLMPTLCLLLVLMAAGIAHADTSPAAPTIQIEEYKYVPDTLTIPAGTKVTWVNKDQVPHTIVASDKTFRSAALDTDENYSNTFTKPGTYQYFCTLHPEMVGTIVVTDEK